MRKLDEIRYPIDKMRPTEAWIAVTKEFLFKLSRKPVCPELISQ